MPSFFVILLKRSVKMGQRVFSNSIGKLYVLFLTYGASENFITKKVKTSCLNKFDITL